jgi:hypothetical protein
MNGCVPRCVKGRSKTEIGVVLAFPSYGLVHQSVPKLDGGFDCTMKGVSCGRQLILCQAALLCYGTEEGAEQFSEPVELMEEHADKQLIPCPRTTAQYAEVRWQGSEILEHHIQVVNDSVRLTNPPQEKVGCVQLRVQLAQIDFTGLDPVSLDALNG